MQYDQLASINEGVEGLRDLYARGLGPVPGTTDELVDVLIGFDVLAKTLEAFAEVAKKKKEEIARVLSDRFVDAGQSSVTRKGKTVYLATEYWPGPSIAGLLPEGVDPSDPEYELTVAKCREAAKGRLLVALKDSANFSNLVVENYNAQSLRSALTGDTAPRNEADEPVLPPELDGLVDLNPRVVVRVRKGGKSS